MKSVKIFVVILLILGYLYLAYSHFYNFIGKINMVSPFQAKSSSFMLENPNAKGTVKYIALGDSLSAGVGSPDVMPTFVYQYGVKLSKDYAKVNVINLSAPGHTTVQLIASQLKPTIEEQPDYITLLIGINDIHNRVSTTTFKTNYEYILNELLNKTKAQIVVINIPYLGSDLLVYPPFNWLLDYRTQQFNKIIFSVSANKERVKLIDLYTPTNKISKENSKFYSDDLFHPSAEGYMLIGNVVNDN